jgi:hypothetical protein
MVLRLAHEHRVLTGVQIADLAFPSQNAARHRLVLLYRLRILDRFRPLTPTGSAPYHYVCDEIGAAVLAAERGITVTELGYRRDHALAVAHSHHLAHIVGVNGLFTTLAGAARRHPNAQLAEWWSEPRCAAIWGEFVRPDGYGRWREAGRQIDFFIEYDRGTEPLTRLADKLPGYTHLAAATGISTPLLLWLPSAAREGHTRTALARATIPVATAHPQPGRGPADAVWLPLGTDGPRRRLIDLATAVIPASVEPAEPGPDSLAEWA